MNEYTAELMVRADHPSLAGHFPGNPIVPGVLLLDEVIGAAERWLGREINVRELPQVKFLQPLRPEESARIRLSVAGQSLKFAIERGETAIAQGTMQFAESP
jgi:3-hydroxyacyl-[acyl-carrier-protein] dehydratase